MCSSVKRIKNSLSPDICSRFTAGCLVYLPSAGTRSVKIRQRNCLGQREEDLFKNINSPARSPRILLYSDLSSTLKQLPYSISLPSLHFCYLCPRVYQCGLLVGASQWVRNDCWEVPTLLRS